MEQYLDQKDGKWHITFWTDLPRVIIKNKLNFRIKNVILNDGSLVSDPQINNSKYIFPIHESTLGKRVFFNFSFDTSEISNISEFKFGLCDEKIKWYSQYIFNVNNEYKEENVEENIISSDLSKHNEFIENIKNVNNYESYIDNQDLDTKKETISIQVVKKYSENKTKRKKK